MAKAEYKIEVPVAAGKVFVLRNMMGYDVAPGKVVIDKLVMGYDPLIKGDVTNWIEIHTQSLSSTGVRDFGDRQAILDEVYRMIAEPWIFYSYIDGEAEPNKLPAYLFTEHIAGLA